jgi:polysaccharide biosynthesis protein PelD
VTMPMTIAEPSDGERSVITQGHEQSRAIGLQPSALAEILLFLAAALLAGAVLGVPDRFAGVSPHPFWIIVLLISSYYGVTHGLVAAGLSTAALLAGNMPEQAFDEAFSVWLARETMLPLMWFLAALALGSIRDGFRRKLDDVSERLARTQQQAQGIAEAYERLMQGQVRLQEQIAAQPLTVARVYTASRAVSCQRCGEVLLGAIDLVGAVLSPPKFSIYLLNGSELEAALCEGWDPQDAFPRHIPAGVPLFDGVVQRHQMLSVARADEESCLQGHGLIAGPLINPDTGAVFGMLKIEQVAFSDFNFVALQNFRIVCEWIGTSLASAMSVEERAERRPMAPAISRGAA